MNEAFPTFYNQTPAGTQEEEAFACKQDAYKEDFRMFLGREGHAPPSLV